MKMKKNTKNLRKNSKKQQKNVVHNSNKFHQFFDMISNRKSKINKNCYISF